MLDNALDIGISEEQFWEMTLAELDRAAESAARRERHETKKRATYDYILSILIGRAFAASMDNKNKFPEIHEVYPSFFEDRETKKQEQLKELSILRFKQFTHSYNKAFKNKEVAISNESRNENHN